MIEPVKSKSKLMKFLSHPVVGMIGMIGTVASMISIPLSIYFYVASKEYSELVYYVHPAKVVLFKKGQDSKLTVYYENKTIDADITLAQVAIWNRGEKSIWGDTKGVVSPIVIHTENNIPILDATIKVSRSRQDIIRFAINKEELQKGRVTVSWNILKHNDGGTVQLIYAAKPDIKIKVDGEIEGPKPIKQFEFSPFLKIRSPEEQYTYYRRGSLMLGISPIIAGIFLPSFIIFNFIKIGKKLSRLDIAILCGMSIFLIAFGSYTLRQTPLFLEPPFGF